MFCSIIMKKLILILFSVILLNCSKKKNISVKYVQHKIEFLNWNLDMPDNYISVSFDDYKTLIKENYTDSIFVASKISQINNFKRNFKVYAMFLDKKNFENNVTIVQMFNPRPNKIVKNQLARMIHLDSKEKGEFNNYIYSPIENRLINDWLIKIKGKKEYKELGVMIYQTSYMASNFGAYVFNTKNEIDFEKELTE